MSGIVVDFEIDKIHYKCTRLADGEYYALYRNSLEIAEDYGFYLSLHHFLLKRGDYLNFAKMYLSLRKLCGKSGKLFDDWKGSFSFPFLVEFKKNKEEYIYLLNIYNHRSALYFNIHKSLEHGDNRYDESVIHQPFEDEFSRQEINDFIVHFYGYLIGYFGTITVNYNELFFKRVDSELILFGCKNSSFFECQFDSQDEYKKAVELLEA